VLAQNVSRNAASLSIARSMNRKIRSILIPLILLVAVGSCQDGATSVEDVQDFYPLAIGNTWKYVMSPWLFRGQTDSSFTEYIANDTVIEKRKWFCVYSTLYPGPVRLLANSPDGLLLPVWQEGHARAVLYYKYPGYMNDSYPISVGADTLTMTIVGTTDTVETPAGIFNCMVYQQRSRDLKGQYLYINTYIQPGVGMILSESYSFDSLSVRHVGATTYLVQFSLK
jgi:hypothetical protein